MANPKFSVSVVKPRPVPFAVALAFGRLIRPIVVYKRVGR